MFYPELANQQNVEKLRNICLLCAMRDPCAEYAIWYESFGFWGGLTPMERRALRRKRGIVIDQNQRDYAA